MDAHSTSPKREPFTLYTAPQFKLTINPWSGTEVDVSHLLTSGRTNYALFQHLTALATGLVDGSEGAASDLLDPQSGAGYEVKAFYDKGHYPTTTRKHEVIHTAASSTFGPNNRGPVIKQLLQQDRYEDALQLCIETGYGLNDFYIYTNTRGFQPGQRFTYLILPTETVIANLSPKDPRVIERTTLLALAQNAVELD